MEDPPANPMCFEPANVETKKAPKRANPMVRATVCASAKAPTQKEMMKPPPPTKKRQRRRPTVLSLDLSLGPNLNLKQAPNLDLSLDPNLDLKQAPNLDLRAARSLGLSLDLSLDPKPTVAPPMNFPTAANASRLLTFVKAPSPTPV